MKKIAIIPARYASTRFPGKPLADIHGKPMIQHVYERCKAVFDDVFVATDDKSIKQAVENFEGAVVMTSPDHQSGTDRCAEAAALLEKKYDFDIVVNVQGDEPFIEKEQLETLLACFTNPETQIATLITPIHSEEILFDPNKVKVTRDLHGKALYFSRQAIPFIREQEKQVWHLKHPYYLHLGIYGYTSKALKEIAQLEMGLLEKTEKLEQLRWLENGYYIATAVTNKAIHGVDTPDDLKKIAKN